MDNEFVHTFAGNPLDRGDLQRRDSEWLSTAQKHKQTRYLAMWRLQIPIQNGALVWIDCERVVPNTSNKPIFLGLGNDVAHFGVDVSNLEDPATTLGLPSDCVFEDARIAATLLPAAELGIVAQCRAQIDWHLRYRFCSVCGSQTELERGGLQRTCLDCKAEHFPRTDPVAIMLITDDEYCLLGQAQRSGRGSGMYSALAGFIDQGESIEEAVRREVREEAGIEVGAITYHSSQPWPFPSSLMIGCHGTALTTDITVDENEMADVRWFSRENVRLALTSGHDDLRLPGSIAIGHQLIRAWALGDT